MGPPTKVPLLLAALLAARFLALATGVGAQDKGAAGPGTCAAGRSRPLKRDEHAGLQSMDVQRGPRRGRALLQTKSISLSALKADDEGQRRGHALLQSTSQFSRVPALDEEDHKEEGGKEGAAAVAKTGASWTTMVAGRLQQVEGVDQLLTPTWLAHSVRGEFLPVATWRRCVDNATDQFVPAAVIGFFIIALLIWMFRSATHRGDSAAHATAETSLAVGSYFVFLDALIFSMTTPEVLSLMRKLNSGTFLTWSMLGAQRYGTALGAVLLFFALRRAPDYWRTGAVKAHFLCDLCNLFAVGSFLHVAGELLHGGAGGPADQVSLLAAMFSGRCVGGLGAGVRLMLLRTHVARLAPSGDRPNQMVRYMFSLLFGVGLGPLLVVLVSAMDPCGYGDPNRFQTVGYVGLVLCIVQTSATWFLKPLEGAVDWMHLEQTRESFGNLSSSEFYMRRQLIICSLVLCSIRSLSLATLDVAAPMLLEHRFHFSHIAIGLLLGACFLTGIIARSVFLSKKEKVDIGTWIFSSLLCALLGSGMLFSFGLGDAVEAAMLLLGCALCCPSYFLCDGLVQGFVMKRTLSASISKFNVDVVNLLNIVLMNAVCLLGAPVALCHIAKSQQNGHATMQVISLLCSVVLFGAVMAPRVTQARPFGACLTETDT